MYSFEKDYNNFSCKAGHEIEWEGLKIWKGDHFYRKIVQTQRLR